MSNKEEKRSRRVRKERRFTPEGQESSDVFAYGGIVGALVLGAGVYSQWVREPPRDFAQYLVLGGAVVFGAALWFGDSDTRPVRVGEAGVAIEKDADIHRLAWCEIEEISAQGKNLIVAGAASRLEVPLGAHPKACAWILREASRRVPDVVRKKGLEGLPKARKSDGERVATEDLEVAGRRCAASDETISFEKDARFCPNCAEVYHRRHVPKTCSSCETELGSSAYRV